MPVEDRHTGRLVGWLVPSFVDLLVGMYLVGTLVGWYVGGWFVCLLVSWLVSFEPPLVVL